VKSVINPSYGKKIMEVRKWDGVTSWNGRIFHTCVLCDIENQEGPGITTPANADYIYVHPWCFEKLGQK
jgi:hypothetical protein